jgi:hypothetical protein
VSNHALTEPVEHLIDAFAEALADKLADRLSLQVDDADDRDSYLPCVGCGKPIHPALHQAARAGTRTLHPVSRDQGRSMMPTQPTHRVTPETSRLGPSKTASRNASDFTNFGFPVRRSPSGDDRHHSWTTGPGGGQMTDSRLMSPKLGPAGAALWRRIVADVPDELELDARELSLLESAACAADRVAELEALIARDGLMLAGSKGQARLHPAVAEARMTRQLCSILLSKISLAAPEPKTGALNVRQRGDLRRLTGGA